MIKFPLCEFQRTFLRLVTWDLEESRGCENLGGNGGASPFSWLGGNWISWGLLNLNSVD